MEEAVRRANTYSEAGADAIMGFPGTTQQMEELPRCVRDSRRKRLVTHLHESH